MTERPCLTEIALFVLMLVAVIVVGVWVVNG